MNLTLSAFSLEISLGTLFARMGAREVFITRVTGQPLRFFSGRREGGNSEFWGLGFYAVTNPV